MNIEQEVYAFVRSIQVKEKATPKEIAMAQEALARLDDYYDEIQRAAEEGRLCHDFSVTVRTEGKTIKFQNIDSVAEWLTNGR